MSAAVMKKTSIMDFAPDVYAVKPNSPCRSVQTVEQKGPARLVDSAEAQLRDRVAGDEEREEDRRYQIREDQHAVLSNLRIGDALHPAQDGVEEDDAHADEHTDLDGHLQKATEDDTHAAHLAGDVRERHEDRAYHGHDACRLGIVPVADEVGTVYAPNFLR